MKTTTLFSIAILVSTMLIGQGLIAQEKKMMKEDKRVGQEVKMVDGPKMNPTKNIVETIVNSKDHTTLVIAIKATELRDILTSNGPFTVFAPTESCI